MYVQDYTNIRERILESIQRDQNVKLDTSTYSYVSQLTNLIAVGDDNILFYMGLLFNEISYENALLPETIYNMNKVLGGSPFSAIPATGKVKVSVITGTLDDDIFAALYKTIPITGAAKYYTIYDYKLSYESSLKKTSVSYTDDFGNIIPVPSVVETAGDEFALSFEAHIKQEEINEIEFISEEDLYEYDLPDISNITGIELYVGAVKYTRVQSNALLEKFSFSFDPYSKKKLLTFATAINGEYIPINSSIKIIYYTTSGMGGNVTKNQLSLSGMINTVSGSQLTTLIEHAPIDTGHSDIDLIELKTKTYNEILLRDTIMSKQYDYDNIRALIKTDSENLVAYRTLGFVPKTSLFVDLKYNGKILRTNSVTIDNYVATSSIQQGMGFSNLGYNDHVDFSNSSDNMSETEIANSIKPVVSPFVVKYNNNLKLAEYFLYIDGSVTTMVPNFAIKSTIDGFTIISYESLYLQYDRTNNTEVFKMQLLANIPDINDIFTDKFEFYGELYIKKSTGLKKIKEVSTIYPEPSSKVTINVSDDGGIYAEIVLPVNAIEVSSTYILKMYIKHEGVLISDYVSENIIIYRKVPLTSPVTKHHVIKHYTRIGEYDNNLEHNDGGGNNIVPDGFRTKAHATITPGLITYRVTKTDIDTSIIKMTDFDYVQLTINVYDVLDGRIISAFDDTFTIEFDLPATFDIDAYYDFILYISGTSIELGGEIGVPFIIPTELQTIPGSVGISIHNVPVVAYADYKMLEEKKDLSLISDRLLTVYDNAVNKALFGTQITVKFLKTYGWVQNIKYNKSLTYHANSWNPYDDGTGTIIEPTELPLALNLNVVNKNEAQAIEIVVVIRRLVKEYFDSIEDPGSGFSRSRLINKIIDELPNVFSLEFGDLDKDIIYDFDQDDVMYDYKEFTPELLLMSDLRINI